MPTLRGLRRRGYTPESLRAFCERIGVAKFNSTIDMAWLEDAIRADLNDRAPRAMGVLRPLKVIIENYPKGEVEELEAANHPQLPEMGTRIVPFSRELWIEADDFMENAPKNFYRLTQGREVRLRYAYFITCKEVVKDKAGNVVELRCTYDPATHGGNAPDGRKVKGTIHWVSALHSHSAAVRLYDHLCNTENPDDVPAGGSFLDNINPKSLEVISDAKVEPSLAEAGPGAHFQFERLGYFFTDPKDSQPGRPVFNRTVTLRDTWAKESAKG
jgi:glutaminyl-tRNA synthetase